MAHCTGLTRLPCLRDRSAALQQFYEKAARIPNKKAIGRLCRKAVMQVIYFVRTIEKVLEMPSKWTSLTNSR
jgi:hypothetical protein